jgi:hypothetical protein
LTQNIIIIKTTIKREENEYDTETYTAHELGAQLQGSIWFRFLNMPAG